MSKEIYKSNFRMWIRVISCVLITAFLWQDVLWANPEAFQPKTHTLAQPTLATDANKVESFKRWTAFTMEKEIRKTLLRGQKPTLSTIEGLLPNIETAARNFGVSEPTIKGHHLDGAIKIEFEDGDGLLYYDPNISPGHAESNAWDHQRTPGKRIAEDKRVIDYDSEDKDYLRAQVIKNTNPASPINILLIQPVIPGSAHKDNILRQQLGLLSIASFLRSKGHSVTILNLDFKNEKTRYKAYLDKIKPDLVGITAITRLYQNACEIASSTKELIPEAKLVLGGVHASVFHGEILKESSFDAVIPYEGEEAFYDLAEEISRNPHDLSSVRGIYWRNAKGLIIENAPREHYIDLDELPFASDALDLVTGANFLKNNNTLPIMPVVTARGCPYNCAYCSGSQTVTKIRLRSAKNVVDELEKLYKTRKTRAFFFWDNTFTLNRKRAIEIADLIIERGLGINFYIQTRADRLDEELVRKLKKAGLRRISIGVESADPAVLREINKELDLEKVKEATETAKRHGVAIKHFYMVGVPGQDWQSVLKTAQFIVETKPDQIEVSFLLPFPGTKYFNDPRIKFSGIKKHDFASYVDIVLKSESEIENTKAVIDTDTMTHDEIKRARKLIIAAHANLNNPTELSAILREIETEAASKTDGANKLLWGVRCNKLKARIVTLAIAFLAGNAFAIVKREMLEDLGASPDFIEAAMPVIGVISLALGISLTLFLVWRIIIGFTVILKKSDIPGLIHKNDRKQDAKESRYSLYEYISLCRENKDNVMSIKMPPTLLKQVKDFLLEEEAEYPVYLLYHADESGNIACGTVTLRTDDGITEVIVEKEKGTRLRQLPEEFITDEILTRSPKNIIFQKRLVNAKRLAHLLPDHVNALQTPRGKSLTDKVAARLKINPGMFYKTKPDYIHYVENELKFKEREMLYFKALLSDRFFRIGDICWWFQHYLTNLIAGLVYASILTYAADLKVLSTFNFVTYLMTLTVIPIFVSPKAAKLVAKLVRSRRDIRSSEKGHIWHRKVQNQRAIDKLRKFFLKIAFVRILFRSSFFILIPKTVFGGMCGAALLFNFTPLTYLCLMFLWWLISVISNQFVMRNWTEVVRGAIQTSHEAIEAGYSRQFDVIVNFGTVFGQMLNAAGIMLGIGIFTMGWLNPIIPIIIGASIISITAGFIIPVFGKNFDLFLEINKSDFIKMKDGSFRISDNILLRIEPPDNGFNRKEKRAVKPIKLRPGRTWLPWLEKMQTELIYRVEPMIEQKTTHIVIKGAPQDPVIRLRKAIGRSSTARDLAITPLGEDGETQNLWSIKLSPRTETSRPKGAYAGALKGRVLPNLKKLDFEEVITLPCDKVKHLFWLSEVMNEVIQKQGRALWFEEIKKDIQYIFDKHESKRPEDIKRLKDTFIYMFGLAAKSPRFRALFKKALRSPPLIKNKKGEEKSSNLGIDGITFAVSSKLPINSARYFHKKTNKAIIVFNEQFFDIDKLIGNDPISIYTGLERASLHVRAERLMHELRHDNIIAGKREEAEEEARILNEQDIPFSEITKDIGMQSQIDRLRALPGVKKAMQHSGDVFRSMQEWLEFEGKSRISVIRKWISGNMPQILRAKAFPNNENDIKGQIKFPRSYRINTKMIFYYALISVVIILWAAILVPNGGVKSWHAIGPALYTVFFVAMRAIQEKRINKYLLPESEIKAEEKSKKDEKQEADEYFNEILRMYGMQFSRDLIPKRKKLVERILTDILWEKEKIGQSRVRSNKAKYVMVNCILSSPDPTIFQPALEAIIEVYMRYGWRFFRRFYPLLEESKKLPHFAEALTDLLIKSEYEKIELLSDSARGKSIPNFFDAAYELLFIGDSRQIKKFMKTSCRRLAEILKIMRGAPLKEKLQTIKDIFKNIFDKRRIVDMEKHEFHQSIEAVINRLVSQTKDDTFGVKILTEESAALKKEIIRYILKRARRRKDVAFLADRLRDVMGFHVVPENEFELFAAEEVACEIIRLQHERSGEPDKKKQAVNIAFTAGGTMTGFMKRLAEIKGIDWSRVHIFQLAEYKGLTPLDEDSITRFLHENLALKARIPLLNLHYLSGQAPDPWYMQGLMMRGGPDITILGVGVNGRIGLNEPGTEGTRTRGGLMEVNFKQGTFFVHDRGIHGAYTMSLREIMRSKKIFLLARGSQKAKAIKRALLGEKDVNKIPATVLQEHPNLTVVLDAKAGSGFSVRRAMQIKAKISGKKYGILPHRSPCHIIDSSGRIVGISGPEARMFGYSPREMLGRHIWDFVPAREKTRVREAIGEKFKEKTENLQGFERTYMTKEGREVTVYITDEQHIDRAGRVAQIFSRLKKISEVKILEGKIKNLTPSSPEAVEEIRKFLIERRPAIKDSIKHYKSTFSLIAVSAGDAEDDVYSLLQKALKRADDIVIKLGNNQFLIALPKISASTVKTVIARRLLKSKPELLLGIANLAKGENFSSLIKRALDDLAKNKGRSGFFFAGGVIEVMRAAAKTIVKTIKKTSKNTQKLVHAYTVVSIPDELHLSITANDKGWFLRGSYEWKKFLKRNRLRKRLSNNEVFVSEVRLARKDTRLIKALRPMPPKEAKKELASDYNEARINIPENAYPLWRTAEDIEENAEDVVNLFVNALIKWTSGKKDEKEELALILDAPPAEREELEEFVEAFKNHIIDPLTRVTDNNRAIHAILENLSIYGIDDTDKIKARIRDGRLNPERVAIVTSLDNLAKVKNIPEFKESFITALAKNKNFDWQTNYYPYVETAFFAILRAISVQYSGDKKSFQEYKKILWRWYRHIPNVKALTEEEFMHYFFDKHGNVKKSVTLIMLPKMKRLDPERLKKIYKRIEGFIRSA
ncbi:MAG: radical SAM protein [Candidatus Omnitrophica bacterium]|nr:radical SAM protein [Candidatus Omnitrophota bacterium]